MHHAAHSAELDIPADICFRYVDDFNNVPMFAFGMKTFQPVGPAEPRLGTRLEGTLQLGPLKFKANGRVSGYVENRLIAVTVERGPITGTTTWRFTPTDSGGAVVAVEVSYEISNGLTGRALAKIMDSILDPAIKYTESKLREQLAEYYRGLSAT